MKLVVPSSGSMIQVRASSPEPCRPPSSPRKPSAGKLSRILATIASSLSLSARVTKSFFFFSEIEPPGSFRQ
jgi:hypothetical protein